MKILSGLSSQTGNIITIILVKKKKEGDLTTGKGKAKWWWKQRLEWCTLKMEEGLQAKKQGQPLEAEKSKDGFSLRASKGTSPMDTLTLTQQNWFWALTSKTVTE